MSRSPERTCVGCREAGPASAMLRLVLGPGGEVAPDLLRRAVGRGAWVHPAAACLDAAAKRGLSKAFRCAVTTSAQELHAALLGQAERRATGLLLAARRAKQLVVGTDEVERALEQDRAVLVIVASDARAAASAPGVQRAVSAGRARVFSDKANLGRWFDKSEVAVVAVLDAGLGRALIETLDVLMIPKPETPKSASRVKEDG
ncbi:MAG: DUF448 domain-containing protein [Polyangiaceae bacterium]